MVNRKAEARRAIKHESSNPRLGLLLSIDMGTAVLCLQTARTVADDHVVDERFLAETLVVLGLRRGDETVVEVIFHQVDGATAEATAHHT